MRGRRVESSLTLEEDAQAVPCLDVAGIEPDGLGVMVGRRRVASPGADRTSPRL